MKQHNVDYNGKEVKVYSGTNVRISDAVYKKVSKYAITKGLKIGKFFEMAAMEKMEREK